jgi:hypothetical protein
MIAALKGLMEALAIVLRALAPLIAEKAREAHANRMRAREEALLAALDRGDVHSIAASFDEHDRVLSEAGVAASEPGQE